MGMKNRRGMTRTWSKATLKVRYYHQLLSDTRLSDGKQVANLEQALFDLFKNEADKVPVNKFLYALETTGVRRDDPRIKETLRNLELVAREGKGEGKEEDEDFTSIDNLLVDLSTFKRFVLVPYVLSISPASHETVHVPTVLGLLYCRCISDNIVLISKAFRQQFVIPEFVQFTCKIEETFRLCSENKDGKVASYIPQLAHMNPNYWGVSFCTVDGQRFSIGDDNIPFTMQSASKVLTYVIAHSELGAERIHSYIGQEPSGRMFNELVLNHNRKPHNPMINAGAILTASLLQNLVRPEMRHCDKFQWITRYFKRLAGGMPIGFNNAVFMSEIEDADRNFALAYYMKDNHCFPEGTNMESCLDLYFQCCSMEVTTETMSVIAATLANGGVCPISGEQVLQSESVRDALSIMHSCGMYDYSGQFAFQVGLPAKSGVSGVIMCVVPNTLGICCFSPPLDKYGNSVRGVQFCKALVDYFNFHRYDNLKHAEDKTDPRRHKYETKGLYIVSLLFSAAAGDVKALRRYRLSGMDMCQCDYDGRTALHLSAAEGHLECVEFLLACGVSARAKDRYCPCPLPVLFLFPCMLARWGHFPIDDARSFGHPKVIQLLEKHMNKIAEEEAEHPEALFHVSNSEDNFLLLDSDSDSKANSEESQKIHESIAPPKATIVNNKPPIPPKTNLLVSA
ncbi:unnamed protein product [Darwinula stevensoni]|uniref:glutaminase n=1 Tax=Darwinula stevensoni TaxID=69355 RepID=A0A7R9A5N5_9CRUS|nr:unnamed protein product [Darwinula stevensoni]CAG0892433.1 unnamed protein product [Darwinula stevensoni]